MLVLMFLTVFTMTPFKRARGTFRGANRPGCNVDYSSSNSAEIKTEYNCNSAPSVCLRGLVRDHFTLLLFFTYMFLGLRSQENEVDWTCSNGEGVVPNTLEF
jgi:hypothetical protein